MRDYESQQAATVMLPQIFRHHRKLEQKADSRQMTARRFGVVPRLDQSKKKKKKLAPLLWPNFIWLREHCCAVRSSCWMHRQQVWAVKSINQEIESDRTTERKKTRGCKSRPFISVIKGVRRGKVLLRIHVYVQKRRSRMEDAGCRAPSASHRHILTDGLTPSDPFHPSPDIAWSTTWPAHWQQRWAITAHALTMRYFVVQTCQSEAVGLLIFRSQICAYIWFFFSLSLSHF